MSKNLQEITCNWCLLATGRPSAGGLAQYSGRVHIASWMAVCHVVTGPGYWFASSMMFYDACSLCIWCNTLCTYFMTYIVLLSLTTVTEYYNRP